MNAEELRVYLWTSSTKAGARPPREKFHLPGQHDQADHGRRGGARAAENDTSHVRPAAEVPEITDTELNAAVKDVARWPSPAARRIGQAALRRYELSRDADAELMLHRANGKVVGAMTLGDSADLIAESVAGLSPEDYLEVEYLASVQKGAGTKLLEAAFERAAETGRGVVLYSLEGATGFYKALGGQVVPGAYNVFHWPPSKVASMVTPKPAARAERTSLDDLNDLVAKGQIRLDPLKK